MKKGIRRVKCHGPNPLFILAWFRAWPAFQPALHGPKSFPYFFFFFAAGFFFILENLLSL
jgi:hypothetical protein